MPGRSIWAKCSVLSARARKPRRIVLYEEASVTTDPHPDAEILAAWADDRLTAAERDAVEAHAADCARCQAVVAAMVRAEPPAEPATPWWRRRATLGWLVPVTGAAAAAVVWLVVAPGLGRQAPAVEPLTLTRAPATPSPMPSPPPEMTMANGDLAARSDKQVDAFRMKDKKEEVRPQQVPLDKIEAARPPASLFDAAPAAPAPVPAPAAGAGGAAPTLDRRATLAEKAKAGTPGEQVGTANEQVTLATGFIALPDVVSSNPASRWRITRTPGELQHSADGGATWELQQTRIPVELTAGASPQPSVCWMVGRGGAVLLTTDNRTWRRVPFIQTTDLVAVSATDDSHATVTTSSGDKFVTADGGATWERAPVQEIPATPF
jgi:hypothetical protein